MYVLLCGKLPFDDDHIPSLFKKIESESLREHQSGVDLIGQAAHTRYPRTYRTEHDTC